MSRLSLAVLILAGLLFSPQADAQTRHFWRVYSPTHGQTFAYGTERNRVWMQRGRDHHLVLMLKYTNDPYVDEDNPRRYDTFFFPFPEIVQGKDRLTFYYRAPSGHWIPVAGVRRNFFGIDEIKLLANASVIVAAPHGGLSVHLDLVDPH